MASVNSKDVPIRSTWRDPIGKPLTDRRILNRMKEGWYGPEAKRVALLKERKTGLPEGVIARCQCGELRGVQYYSYSYLERHGFYCKTCLNQQRLLKPETKTERFNKIIAEYMA